jgi:hypothetical protein
MQIFGSILKAEHVDLHLAGHRHIYERFSISKGLRRFIAGIGGKSHGAYPPNVPAGAFVNNTDYGVLSLRLGEGDYGWTFVPVDGFVDGAPDGVESGASKCN